MVTRDTIAAGVLLAGSAVAIQQSTGLPFGNLHRPGPGFVPFWTSVIVLGLTVVLLAQVVLRPAPAGATPARGRIVKVGALLAALAVYTALLEPAGYLISTFLLVVFMLRVIDRHPWPLALVIALVGAAGSYVLFAVWLNVPLPPIPWVR
jgi:putative tricarboxylic transport membrane protein